MTRPTPFKPRSCLSILSFAFIHGMGIACCHILPWHTIALFNTFNMGKMGPPAFRTTLMLK